jgi:hypothetical protein
LGDDKAGPAAWLQLVRQMHAAAAADGSGSAAAAAGGGGLGSLLHVVPRGRGLVLYHANDWVLVSGLSQSPGNLLVCKSSWCVLACCARCVARLL